MLADKSAKNSDNYSRIKEKFLDFKANLPKNFQKNQGRNFTNFLAKEYDDFIKSYSQVSITYVIRYIQISILSFL